MLSAKTSVYCMITYKHLPRHNKTPGANLGFQENEEFPKDSQLTDVAGVRGDDSERVPAPWDNMNIVGYSHNHHTWYTKESCKGRTPNTAENGRCLRVASNT